MKLGSAWTSDRRWLALYDENVPSSVSPVHPTVLHAFNAALESDPSYPLLRYRDKIVTIRDANEQSDALAGALADAGFQRGDRLAIYLQNVPQFIIGALAAWKLAGAVVTVNPMYRDRELREVLADSGARALLCETSDALPKVEQTAKDTGVQQIIDCNVDFDLLSDRYSQIQLEHRRRRWSGALPTPDDIATLIYTSGTTGPLKAATSSHANLAHSAEVYRQWASITSSDILIAIAPLVHVTGMVGYLALACVTPATLVLTYRFSPHTFAAAVMSCRATFTIGPTTAFIALTNDSQVSSDALSSLTKSYSGGAPIPLAVVERFERKFGHRILGIYGLTEATGPTHMVPRQRAAPVDPATGTLSVGIPVPDIDCTVVADSGKLLGAGEPGEIILQGPQIATCYWRREAETAATFTPSGLRTGDIGFADADGWFFVIDRKKDQINASGFKIWPRDVEEVIYEHPAVSECAVVGIPDDYRGETVRACIVLRTGLAVTEQDIVDFCRQRMAAYKVPRSVVFMAELPKTASGKILRRALNR